MLYLVATPIGHLKDITLRALEVLKAAEVIVCEDTRRTGQLLKHHGIVGKDGVTPPLLSFHEHSGPGRVREILSLLKEGKEVALVSDGGMPLISDPGFPLVREAAREGIRVEAIPGPSAVVTALAASGLPTEHFTFWGFLPAKSARRKKELKELRDREETLVFFESPYRVLATLQDMLEIFGDREASLCRELTKKFEEIVRGDLRELVARFEGKKILGEIVLVVAGKDRKKVYA
jgi:16S rRNA (cytidine1402-2'-O)-methyltransferase